MATDTLAPAAAIAAPRIKSELMQQRVRAARLFLVPMLVALAIVAGWPLLRSIYFSFTDASLNNLDAAEWYGLGNYLRWTVLESGNLRWRGLLPVELVACSLEQGQPNFRKLVLPDFLAWLGLRHRFE